MELRDRLIVPPDKPLTLADWDPDETLGFEKEAAVEKTEKAIARLDELQYLMYAEHRRALLVVLQGMDGAGKDGTIRHVMRGLNPEVAIFNRSHYEDVLAAGVRKLVPKNVWTRRYDHINGFEQLLTDSSVVVVKFFLHISKDEQRRRFEERLRDPTKQWKLSPSDFEDRKQWTITSPRTKTRSPTVARPTHPGSSCRRTRSRSATSPYRASWSRRSRPSICGSLSRRSTCRVSGWTSGLFHCFAFFWARSVSASFSAAPSTRSARSAIRPSSERSSGCDFSLSRLAMACSRSTTAASRTSIASSRRLSKLPGAKLMDPTMALTPSARSNLPCSFSPLSLRILIPTSSRIRRPPTPSTSWTFFNACGGRAITWTFTPRRAARTSRSRITESWYRSF